MNTQYFNPTMTTEMMKGLYRELVKKFHPDINHGISDEFIKAINNEYSFWYARAASDEVYNRKTQEAKDKGETRDYSKYTSSAYVQSLEDMINWLLSNNIDRIDGIEVELVGVFIWVAGITYDMADVRAIVKNAGFQGSYKYHDDGSREYMWKWTPEIKRFNSNPNIDDIKRTYGSVDVRRKNTQKRLG